MGGQPRLGSFLVMNQSSVIVFQIDVDRIAFDPTECNAPVSAGGPYRGQRAHESGTLASSCPRDAMRRRATAKMLAIRFVF